MTPSRYDRQIILKEFGVSAQERLAKAKVLVVGAGGLGVPVLQYLNAMGVGHLAFMDADVVQESNLHRQVIYTEKQIGMPKVNAATAFLAAQNSHTKLEPLNFFLDSKNALATIARFDVVVDASDNFPTRYLVNDACVILKKPFIYGALHGFEGQLSVFNYNSGPTYRCLFPKVPKANEIPNCDTQGVLGILPGIVGNLQALECVKVLTGIGAVLAGKLLIFDALKQAYHTFEIPKQEKALHLDKLQSSYALDCPLTDATISTAQFKQLSELPTAIQIIDVRNPEEVAAQAYEGAVNIPLSVLENEIKKHPLQAEVYFLCQSGFRSAKAVELLQEQFPNKRMISVAGGINALFAHEY